MRITCLGAARTVTGSSYLVEPEPGSSFLVDCGLFQGGRRLEENNRDNQRHRPGEIQGIFITHAHIDHSGLVPRLVRLGYRGPVFASKATAELLRILWADSAHIQEMEAQWQSRKNKRKGRPAVEPLYEAQDAETASGLIQAVEMDAELRLVHGARTTFVTAGHILGAASLLLTLEAGGREHKVGFTGDLGRPGQLIVPDPAEFPRPDTLFMETTYGNRTHKTLADSQAELLAVVQQAYADGGKVLIPAFAVERTQEIIYTLAAAHRDGKMPADMPVFLDSPLAIRATEIFRQHPEFFDEPTFQLLAEGHTPLNLPNLKFTLTTEESQAINRHSGPAVIIAGNGMASAGRIKHHLKHNLWRPNCHVVLVGFQARGTTGRLLVDGARRVKVFREDVTVAAEVHTIGGFSAHADRDELLAWLEPLARPGLRVNLVHGEERASLAFKETAAERFPEVDFRVPRQGETLELERPAPRRRAAARPVAAPEAAGAPKPGPSLERVESRLRELAERLEARGGSLSPEMLAALDRQVRQAERLLQAGEGV
jgi:metallo-beta-lactamase family protein